MFTCNGFLHEGTLLEAEKLKHLLEQIQSGQLDIDSALIKLRKLPFENLDGFATIDHHRALRNGFPEVIFGQGKQPDQVTAIARRLSERNAKVLVRWSRFFDKKEVQR